MVLFLKGLFWARLMLLGSFNNLESLKEKQNVNFYLFLYASTYCQGVVAGFRPHYFLEITKAILALYLAKRKSGSVYPGLFNTQTN